MTPPKTSRHEIDMATRNRIVGYAQATGNAAAAGRKENVNERTAQLIYKHYLQTGNTSDEPRSGRPSKLNDYDIRQLIREVRKYRRTPLTQITNQLATEVSVSTVRRTLAAEGYHRRVARKVPYLSPFHKCQRLAWARIHRTFRPADWKCTMFSDECYVYLGDNHGRIYVTRRPDEWLLEECLVPTFKQSTVRVMVWGCIMEGRKGPLVVLEYPGGKGGGLNSNRYREQVLEPVLLNFYHLMNQERRVVRFQQDGAPSHRSKATKKWFADHGIPLAPHPSSSPDLNPIEPIWHVLKTILRRLEHPPTTVETLRAAVFRAWEEIPLETINRHIGNMGHRVEAVLAARGGHTRF
ncbi:hypothetical protein NLJ89_g5358 [Agrocybe chaxingu]|uniref:Transposase n=1 Tax=Agrocybe chaxingu TaxID=84603 RepID=A0A9W8MV30_9AGAR|nr:hypothetical protein NLJ89_g5358 [Agrocybe chaxingu]